MYAKIRSQKAKKKLFIKGMLVKDLANELNVSPTYTSNFLNGKCNVSSKIAFKISGILEIPVEELFEIYEKEEV